jgi:cell division protein FtsZ
MPKLSNMKPRIAVIGVGGAGGNAVNNMIAAGLTGVQFIVANTDIQALASSKAEHRIQLGMGLTDGLGAGSKPEIGEAAVEEVLEEIGAHIRDAHMVFIAAGMGGGTGTGAAYVIARMAKEFGILTIAVVTKPFQFEGSLRTRNAEAGIKALTPFVDTLLVIPNENLFRVATDKTTFAEAFLVADQVLYSGIACLVDLIVEEGLINLDLADVRTVLGGMGAAMMGTGEAAGEQRAVTAAEEAIVNPLLDGITLKGAKSLLLSITGCRDLTLWEVDEVANRVRQEVDPDANIIVGTTVDDNLGDKIRVSIVASGMPTPARTQPVEVAEGPAWTPRFLEVSARSDDFGRRLTEAKSERSHQAKTRAGQKGRGRDQRPPSETSRRREGAAKSTNQPPVIRSRRMPAAKDDAVNGELEIDNARDGIQQASNSLREISAPVAEDAAIVGWPAHWARSTEAVQTTQGAKLPVAQMRPALRRIEASPQHVGPPENRQERRPDPPARKSTFLQRLSELVGNRREA